MLFLLWGLSILLGLVWTGFAVLSVKSLAWLSERAAQGQLEAGMGLLSQQPLPEPLAVWVESIWWAWMQTALASASGWISQLGVAMSWLEPLIWVVWAIGMLALLLLTAILHLVLRQFFPTAPRAD